MKCPTCGEDHGDELATFIAHRKVKKVSVSLGERMAVLPESWNKKWDFNNEEKEGDK